MSEEPITLYPCTYCKCVGVHVLLVVFLPKICLRQIWASRKAGLAWKRKNATSGKDTRYGLSVNPVVDPPHALRTTWSNK